MEERRRHHTYKIRGVYRTRQQSVAAGHLIWAKNDSGSAR